VTEATLDTSGPAIPSSTSQVRSWLANRHVRRIGMGVIWLAVAILAARLLADAWGQLDPSQLRFSIGGLALIAVLLLFARGTDVAGWHRLLRGAGASTPFVAAAHVYTTSELVRYLPGGVLHFAARYRYATKLGVTPAVVVATTAIDLALRLASGLAVFALSIPFWPDAPRSYSLLTAAALPILLVGSHPRVLGGLIVRAERKLGKVAHPLVLPYGVLVRALLWYGLGWFARGAVTWIIAWSITGASPSTWVPILGATGLSWVVGVLTPFAPGGLGTREAAGAALLRQYFPIETGVAIMIVVRLATTLTEFLSAGLVVAWVRLRHLEITPDDTDVADTRREALGAQPPSDLPADGLATVAGDTS
jgi:hypothetical protein